MGILANTNLTGDITNSGTITLDEDFTPTDTDKDGDLDGPFAQGSGRFGIHVLGGGTYTGVITNSGTIAIEGNQSAGIAIDSNLFGSLLQNGKITVLGDNSFGVHTGAVAGNVIFGSANSIAVQGQNSVGAQIGGDIGGVLVVQGTIASTGYRSTSAPADVSKLDADDLLQGGSALVLGGSIGAGALIDSTAKITTFGAAPAMVIGSATQDINIALVPTTDAGIVIKGAIGGAGVYAGVSGTGLSIGGMGHAVNVAGGLSVTGGVVATSLDTNATAIYIGAGASVPQINVNGTVTATGAGTSGSAAQAIVIDAGATVNGIANSGTIAATRSGSSGTAAAIVDHSGTLALIQNNGQIGITNAADIGDAATAIDVRATVTGATVRQIAAASGGAVPLISGSILFGAGTTCSTSRPARSSARSTSAAAPTFSA